ncbi:MAG: hypothetical protein CMJ62_07980 [Planctomycetaceae bacterium]|nr:hypothetical protein [Planctomycetaceae bacterium]
MFCVPRRLWLAFELTVTNPSKEHATRCFESATGLDWQNNRDSRLTARALTPSGVRIRTLSVYVLAATVSNSCPGGKGRAWQNHVGSDRRRNRRNTCK